LGSKKILDLIYLKIEYASGKSYILKLAYSDIKSEEIQKELKKIHSARKNGNVRNIVCLCNKKRSKEPLVHIRETKGKYTIVSNPNKKKEHDEYCLLGEPINKYVNFEQDIPQIKSFDIFYPPYSSNSRKYHNEEREKREEKTRRITFSLLMGLLLGEAYSFAFASKNKINGQKISRCSSSFPAKMPTIEEVISKFFLKFKDTFPKKGRLSFEEFKKKFVLKLGVVESLTYDEKNNLLKFKGIYFKPQQKKFEFLLPRQKVSNIIASRKAYSPSKVPLFISSIEDKSNHRINKAYIYPIAYKNKNESFIPVDSENERSFIKKLYTHGLKFVKPLKTNLTWHTFFTSLDIYRYILDYTYTPDLIIFKGKTIAIVEIIDKNMLEKDPNYAKNLENKENLCQKLRQTIQQNTTCQITCIKARNYEELMEKLSS